jgi:hypothetical protein
MLGRGRIAALGFAATVVLALGLAASAPASFWQPQTIRMTITKGDHALPMNMAVWPGEQVVLKVRNYTHQYHTFTVPALGVSALIYPAGKTGSRVTTVRFTAQKQHVAVVWLCAICPSGVHGHGHAMTGRLYSMVR